MESHREASFLGSLYIPAYIYGNPKEATKGETVVYTLTSVATTLVQRPKKIHGPPCCAGTLTHSDQDCLVPGRLLLTSTIIPINVLIDTGCIQTNVFSDNKLGTYYEKMVVKVLRQMSC